MLSSDDPVRVYQQFATVELLSGGRAEIMAGRGSFIESFPLFGYDLADHDQLFEEQPALLLQVRDEAVVRHARVAVRAGRLGLPMALAIIGGMPQRFSGFVKRYRESGLQAGHSLDRLPVGIHVHGFVARDSQQAADLVYPAYAEVMSRIGRERGWSPTKREQFEAGRTLQGALAVGSPDQVVEKLLLHHEWFGHPRQLVQMSVGTLPHAELMKSIELFGVEVVPKVRAEIARREAPAR